MTSSSGNEAAAVAGTANKHPVRANILLRAVVFVSVHLALVAAVYFFYRG